MRLLRGGLEVARQGGGADVAEALLSLAGRRRGEWHRQLRTANKRAPTSEYSPNISERRPAPRFNAGGEPLTLARLSRHLPCDSTQLTDFVFNPQGTDEETDVARRDLVEVAMTEQNIDDDHDVDVDGDEMVAIDPEDPST